METIKKVDNRTVLLIDPPFQKSFLKYTVGSALGVSVFYFAAISVFFSSFRDKGLAMGLSADHIFFRFLDEQKMSLDIIFLVTTLLMTMGLMIYGLYLSNRIAGPIHHVKRYLREFREGLVNEPLKFREKDYFEGLADEVNQSLKFK